MSVTESLKDAATYAALRAKLAWLTHKVHAHAQTVTTLASDVDDAAEQMLDAAETMKALAVDDATTAEFADAALTMTGVKDAAGAYTSAADSASAAADDAKTTTENDHGGIAEAVDSSPVDMAEAAFYTQS
jgi:methionine-rich copper-binding protein CopC